MDCYLLALEALAFLFAKTHVHPWAEWITRDIDAWKHNRSVAHHLQAYGTMGSINDVIICVQNQCTIERWQEPWANAILQVLLAWCHRLAEGIEAGREPSRPVLDEVSVFQLATLSGLRCLQCGYGELSESDIDAYFAGPFVDRRLRPISDIAEMRRAIEALLCARDAHIITLRRELTRAASNSGVHLVEKQKWRRPCPHCGSDDTAVYRWAVKSGPLRRTPVKLVPDVYNLPLRDTKKDE